MGTRPLAPDAGAQRARRRVAQRSSRRYTQMRLRLLFLVWQVHLLGQWT